MPEMIGDAMEEMIRFQNVSFAYETEGEAAKPVLEGFDLTVHTGEFLAVLGHNGCGKSTVAKLCNGIELPQRGQVLVKGLSTDEEENLLSIRQTVGMVFQNPDNQIVATIVEDDVAFGPENLGVEPQEIRRRVDDALRRVDMYDFRRFEPHKLSGGQKQRVAIAGVIAMHPACIVLDEPTAMLDPRGRKDVMETVRMLNREHGITIVLITHYMDEAVQADRVVVMNKGKILLDGEPRRVFTQTETLKSAGLDVPQATALASALKKDGLPVADDLLTVETLADAIAALAKQPSGG